MAVEQPKVPRPMTTLLPVVLVDPTIVAAVTESKGEIKPSAQQPIVIPGKHTGPDGINDPRHPYGTGAEDNDG